jgi:hypothetical protein
MESLSPHVVTLFTTTGTALIMVFMGLRKNTLEWRRSPRRCAVCGRKFRSRTCSCQ